MLRVGNPLPKPALGFLAILLVVARAAAAPLVEFNDVFPDHSNGVARHRIPGVVVTAKGTVLAYCEARKNGSSDWGEIEVHLRRSTDGGRTWSKPVKIAHAGARIEVGNEHGKKGHDRTQTVNNPVAIVDRATGAVEFLYCLNYSRCFSMRSTDDGLTWSRPVEITASFEPLRKYRDWKVIATGPGHGVQLANGRLVVPVWFAFGGAGDHGPSATATIFSDDHGKTWHAGDVALPDTPEYASPNETAAAALADGRVMLVTRNHARPNRKLVTTSRDGAAGWAKPSFADELWEPRCMAALLAYPAVPGGVLYSCPRTEPATPGGKSAREKLSIQLSRDDGRTWPVLRELDAGPSAYSDLAVLADGTVLCLYEANDDIRMARFNLEWLEGGAGAGTGCTWLDLAGDAARQVVVDREPGTYLGHPTTVLLEDGKTILCVYPKGHGKGEIVFKKSTDGGLTWSDRLPVPGSWSTSKETPTIHRVVDAAGKKRLILFSGLHPTRMSVSEDDGATWSELTPVGPWGGIVVMGSVVPLRTGPGGTHAGEYMAFFHDDGRFFSPRPAPEKPVRFTLYSARSADGGLTWSVPKAIQSSNEIHLCEPGVIRSPDGTMLAMLLRENARRKNSHVMFSRDEGKTWTEPRELPGTLCGDRHVGVYAPDGRLYISFRDSDLNKSSPTAGDWVAWVGTWDDIEQGRDGQYRVRLMDNTHRGDCAYPGVEVLPDGTIVTTTYGHWQKGEPPFIMSVRLKLDELDALARAAKR